VNRFVLTLVVIGAINWLLVGLFHWDLISTIFGGNLFRPGGPTGFSRIIYSLIGLAGLYSIGFLFNDRFASRED
jgi:uncharacterized protein